MEPVLGKAFRDGDDLGEAGETKRGGRDKPSAISLSLLPRACSQGHLCGQGATLGAVDEVVRSTTAGLCLKHLTASAFRTLGVRQGHPKLVTVSNTSEVWLTWQVRSQESCICFI